MPRELGVVRQGNVGTFFDDEFWLSEELAGLDAEGDAFSISKVEDGDNASLSTDCFLEKTDAVMLQRRGVDDGIIYTSTLRARGMRSTSCPLFRDVILDLESALCRGSDTASVHQPYSDEEHFV
eukprot:3979277-Amphidinium_carterae.2